MKHKFPCKWNLKDGYPSKGIKPNGLNVFGTFICGGGSSMGYKLAGFNHLGGVEIDKKVADVYQTNHNPKYLFVEDLREFNKRNDLPEKLYNLDLLDGSPPCSTFSMAGSREKAWGKAKKFREGQALQTLDDLVFTYIETIEKLRPKVCLLENVKGIIQGNAKVYSKEVVKRLTKAGYKVPVFLLNAASMGVPQKRERVFFIGLRDDFNLPKLELSFNEKAILFSAVDTIKKGQCISGELLKWWSLALPGTNLSRVHPEGHYFGSSKLGMGLVSPTLIASGSSQPLHPKHPNYLSSESLCLIGSYPLDYNFKEIKPNYLIGMSVPPVMAAQIAHQIYLQWLSKC